MSAILMVVARGAGTIFAAVLGINVVMLAISLGFGAKGFFELSNFWNSAQMKVLYITGAVALPLILLAKVAQAIEAGSLAAKEAITRQQRAWQERRQENARIAARKREIALRIAAYPAGASNLRESLPSHIAATHRALDRAEQELMERVFIPFWNEIASATHSLSRYRNAVADLETLVRSYDADAKALGRSPDKRFIQLGALPDPSFAIRRMEELVRLAHKDADFSTIFLQMRTNELLQTGFRNLEEALQNVGWAVESAISALGDAIGDKIDLFAEKRAAQDEKTEQHRDRIENMLDTIRQRRRP